MIKKTLLTPIFALSLFACSGTSPDEAPAIPVDVDQTMVPVTSASALDWNSIQAYSVSMEIAPAVHQSVELRQSGEEPTVPISFKAVKADGKLYIRLMWADESKNAINAFDKFADGAAVQFALQAGPDTSYMMGDMEDAVNIWYWKAGSEGAQNLIAGGFGTTTRMDDQSVDAAASWDQGSWTVTFSRPLTGGDENQAALNGNTVLPVAFAVWQGDTRQRDGLKHTTPGWVLLDLGDQAAKTE